MKYNVASDLGFISKFLGISQEEFSFEVDIPKETLSRIINKVIDPSDELLEKIYSFIYDKFPQFNKIKTIEYQKNHEIVLYHGSRDKLIGDISLDYSREKVDFGVGFYAGDNYEQSLDFVCQTKHGSIYVLDVNYSNLKKLDLDISIDWMLLIAYNRGKLGEYKDSKILKNLINSYSQYDIIVAPIADNRMFSTIDDFVSSAISTEQAIHALKDLSLGKQIIFRSEKAIKQITILERLYVSKEERKAALEKKIEKIRDADSYISDAYKKYIRQGKYIEEVFSDEKDG